MQGKSDNINNQKVFFKKMEILELKKNINIKKSNLKSQTKGNKGRTKHCRMLSNKLNNIKGPEEER